MRTWNDMKGRKLSINIKEEKKRVQSSQKRRLTMEE